MALSLGRTALATLATVVWLVTLSVVGCQLSDAPTREQYSRKVTIWSPTGSRAVASLDGFYGCADIRPRGDRRIFLEAQEGSGRERTDLVFEWNRAAERFERRPSIPPDDSAARPTATSGNTLVTQSGRVLTLTNASGGATWTARLYSNGWRDVDAPPWKRLLHTTALDLGDGAVLLADGNDGAAMEAFVLPAGDTHWTSLPPILSTDTARREIGTRLFSVGGGKVAAFTDEQATPRRLVLWDPVSGHVGDAPGPSVFPAWSAVAALDADHLLVVGGTASPGEEERNPALFYLYPLLAACILACLAGMTYLATRRTAGEAASVIVGAVIGVVLFIGLFAVFLVDRLSHARFN